MEENTGSMEETKEVDENMEEEVPSFTNKGSPRLVIRQMVRVACRTTFSDSELCFAVVWERF